MNPAHLHLLLNHIPVIGIPLILLLLMYGAFRKSDEIKKAGMIALVLLTMITVPSYLTGEPAEDVIENAPGVSESYIGAHEDSAMISLIATGILGVLALWGLIMVRRQMILPVWLFGLILFVAMISAGLLSWTANLGGKIRHTEIRADATVNLENSASGTHNEKDDD